VSLQPSAHPQPPSNLPSDFLDQQPEETGVPRTRPPVDAHSQAETFVQPISSAQSTSRLNQRRTTRREALRVRRIVYGFELWSVLKVSLLFYFCVWGVFLLAGLLLWGFAVSSGYIERFENFILEIFNYETFTVNGSEIFEWYIWAGLFSVLLLTALTVILCLLYNLISVLVGGVRMTVVEEETVRFRHSRQSRPRRSHPRRTSQTPGRFDA